MKSFALILGAAASLAVLPNLATASTVVSSGKPLRASLQAQAGAASSDLAAKVKSQIDANSSGSEVAVTAEGGVVTLKGVAPDAVVRLKIVEAAQKTEGVTKVVNKITIAKKK